MPRGDAGGKISPGRPDAGRFTAQPSHCNGGFEVGAYLEHQSRVTTHREVITALAAAAAQKDDIVLATVVRVTGSSYGGVGARMVIRGDNSTVGLVSGGCLESDLAEHARRVRATGRAEVVRYDTRDDDDAPWGLGLGCNGLIDVLIEPLQPAAASRIATLLEDALGGDTPAVIATVVRTDPTQCDLPRIGAHALLRRNHVQPLDGWGAGSTLDEAARHLEQALAGGRRGFACEIGPVEVAFEVVVPAVRLVVCGTGPDVAPVSRFGSQLGWDVTVVDHRPLTEERSTRFPGARVVGCPDPLRLADSVPLNHRTAVVVMSHSFPRDRDYVRALIPAEIAYIGVLGPRARTERMLGELAALEESPHTFADRFFAPVGIDLGGEGPDAIALSIISQVSTVVSGRTGGHLRDRNAPLHGQHLIGSA